MIGRAEPKEILCYSCPGITTHNKNGSSFNVQMVSSLTVLDSVALLHTNNKAFFFFPRCEPPAGTAPVL